MLSWAAVSPAAPAKRPQATRARHSVGRATQPGRATRPGDHARHSLSDVTSNAETPAAIRVVAAVLRRGEGDHLVAQLEVSVGDAPDAFNDDPAEVVQVPSSDDGGGEPEASIVEVADVPGAPDYASRIHAELCVLSTSCRGDWELMQAVPIVYDGEAC